MSTILYLRCLDHDPIIKAWSESGQRTADLPQIRADIANRRLIVDAWNKGEFEDTEFDSRMATASFLVQHPHCSIGIIDEYGQTYPRIAPVHNHTALGRYGNCPACKDFVPDVEDDTAPPGCTFVFKDLTIDSDYVCQRHGMMPWPKDGPDAKYCRAIVAEKIQVAL